MSVRIATLPSERPLVGSVDARPIGIFKQALDWSGAPRKGHSACSGDMHAAIARQALQVAATERGLPLWFTPTTGRPVSARAG